MNRTIPNGAAILLAFVRKTEVSRDDRASYDVIYANKQGKLAIPLTSMTYGDIIDAQRKWSKNNGSSAAGAYQFMRATLIDLAKENPSLRGDDVFTPDLQDQLGYALLLRRGYATQHRGLGADPDVMPKNSRRSCVGSERLPASRHIAGNADEFVAMGQELMAANEIVVVTRGADLSISCNGAVSANLRAPYPI